MKCDLKPTLSCTYINLRRERGKGEGEKRMRGNNQGKGGETDREGGKKKNLHRLQKKNTQKNQKQMGHGYKENGKVASRRKKEGRNKRKRLVMSMSSVASFVDSPRVSMTTSSKIPPGE